MFVQYTIEDLLRLFTLFSYLYYDKFHPDPKLHCARSPSLYLQHKTKNKNKINEKKKKKKEIETKIWFGDEMSDEQILITRTVFKEEEEIVERK